jgi:hypothetical protein
MRVRQMVQGEVERSTAALGIPGRTELDSVHKRMAEMRRRIADLEEKLAQATAAPSPREKPVRTAKETPAKPAAKAVKAVAKRPVISKVAARPAVAVAAQPVSPEPKAPAAVKETAKKSAATVVAPKSTTRRSRS